MTAGIYHLLNVLLATSTFTKTPQVLPQEAYNEIVAQEAVREEM